MKRIAVLLIFAATAVEAQQTSVRGTVVDPSGAPVYNACAMLMNVARNQTQMSMTDARGRFRFPTLPVGDYHLQVLASGFATFDQQMRLTVGAAVDVPIRLQVETQETINVSASAPVVETERTHVSSNVTPEEVRDLPLNGRNYLELALLAPGTSRTNTGANQRFAETSAVPGTGISISTQRNLANTFIVDGLSANDDAAGLAGTFFSQDVIREFEVVRAGGSAEYGRASAGIINIVTQSGTNEMRGDAYGFFRNQRLDAPNALTGTKLPLNQTQYGISAGGPLARNRTFVFTNFEQTHSRTPGVITIAPAVAALLHVATGPFDITLDTTNVHARFDHTLTQNDQLMLRLSTYDVSSDNARTVGGINAESRGTSLENRDRTAAMTNTWIVNNALISESRGQLTRSRLSAPPNDLTGPAITINGVANIGTATVSPTQRNIDLIEVAQHVTWMREAHTVKAGVDYLRNQLYIAFPGPLQGAYTFTNLANYLAGSYSSYQQAFGDPDTSQTNPNLGLYIQDQWRVTPRVVLNGGLRFDRDETAARSTPNDFSPRIAAAWDIRGDGQSLVRAAAGMYYDPIPLRAVANALQRNGVTYRIVQIGPAFPGAPVFPDRLTTFPSTLLTNITTIDPNIRNSRSDQLLVQYEQQIHAATSAAIAYEHLRGRDIIMSRRFGNNTQYQSVGDSWYDGLTIDINHRPVSWGSFRASYTFSKGLDTSGNFFFSQPQDADDIAAERGRSDNDQRHRLVLSGTFNTHGWLFSGIYTYTSALPFNILLPNDRNGDGNFNDRPAGVGRNTGRGFDFRSLDLRASRRIGRVELLVDAFNVFNRANYQVPINVVTLPTFGQPTAVNDPRQVQLGVRLLY
jgi:hypothetical protein